MRVTNAQLEGSGALPQSQLPPSDSVDVALDQATSVEMYETWLLNYHAWGDERPLSFYLAKEDYLCSQPLTRDGGITHWVLVDVPPSQSVIAAGHSAGGRRILSSCDTIRKRGFVAARKETGQCEVKEVVTHTLYSVFTRPEYRHRGYATRMLEDLKQALLNHDQKDGESALFATVYSDIGKDFYSRHGWEYAPSFSLSLPPKIIDSDVCNKAHGYNELHLSRLGSSDLPELCLRDEKLVKRDMQKQLGSIGAQYSVALAPDHSTMQWHHAGEEITTSVWLGRFPNVKGVMATTSSGRVWCIWTRTIDQGKTEKVLNILRVVIDKDEEDDRNGQIVAGVKAILQNAQREAAEWGLHHVDIWNPVSLVREAVLELMPDTKVEHREDGIACLMRYGFLKASKEVQWIANEKFGNWF